MAIDIVGLGDISDHFLIYAIFDLVPDRVGPMRVTFRDFSGIKNSMPIWVRCLGGECMSFLIAMIKFLILTLLL